MRNRKSNIPTGIALFAGLAMGVCIVVAGWVMSEVVRIGDRWDTITWVMVAFLILLLTTLAARFVFRK